VEAEVVVEPEPKSRRRLLARKKRDAPVEEPRTRLFELETVDPHAEPIEVLEEPAATEPELVAPALELVYEAESEPEPASKSRRKRRLPKRSRRDDDVVEAETRSLFETAWPPPPSPVEHEAVIDLTEAENAVWAAPPGHDAAAASVEPDIDLTIDEPLVIDTRNGARGWRLRHSGGDQPEEMREGVAREVVVPEIVGEPVVHDLRNGNGNDFWAAPPGHDVAPVEVVDAPKPVAQPTVDLPAQTRAVRVKTVKVNGKKRWVVDVLVRQDDEKPQP
jgi:hypothetical protein